MKECFVYTKKGLPESTTMKNIDVTTIFGICESSMERPLLLLRFHKELKINGGQGRKFYKYLYEKYIKKDLKFVRLVVQVA